MKYILDEEYDYDFSLIGISCHEKDYRICWGLNKHLKISLSKDEKDLEVMLKNTDWQSKHSLYNYIHPDSENEFHLLTNRSSIGYLLPEQAHADYLLMITENEPIDLDGILQKVREIPFVLTAFNINVMQLKSKENLLF